MRLLKCIITLWLLWCERHIELVPCNILLSPSACHTKMYVDVSTTDYCYVGCCYLLQQLPRFIPAYSCGLDESSVDRRRRTINTTPASSCVDKHAADWMQIDRSHHPSVDQTEFTLEMQSQTQTNEYFHLTADCIQDPDDVIRKLLRLYDNYNYSPLYLFRSVRNSTMTMKYEETTTTFKKHS